MARTLETWGFVPSRSTAEARFASAAADGSFPSYLVFLLSKVALLTPNMPLTDDELLASNPDAAGLIAAGVPFRPSERLRSAV
jgi:hypothetical protein